MFVKLNKHLIKFVAVSCISTALFFGTTFIIYADEATNVIVTANILNLRESPNTTSKILDTLKKGEQLKVIKSSTGWLKVTENGITGWINNKFVENVKKQSSPEKVGTIKGNNVNIRKGPGLTYDVLKTINKDAKLSIIQVSGNWYKVKTSEGIIGWVSSSYILMNSDNKAGVADKKSEAEPKNTDKKTENETKDKDKNSDSELKGTDKKPNFESIDPDKKSDSESKDSDKNPQSEPEAQSKPSAAEIIEYAKSYLGVKYTYGGTSPDTGFDCSGFTKYVFDKFGIKLNRVSSDQATQGIEVAKDDLMPGDLVFSDTDGGNNNITHVGIYIGEGLFINAQSSNSTGQITIADINSSYWQRTYMTARRVL